MDQRNMILAFALSMIVLLGWGYISPHQKKQVHQQLAQVRDSGADTQAGKSSDTGKPLTGLPAVVNGSVAEANPALFPDKHYTASNNLVHLTINAKGWFTQARLDKYRVSIKPDAANVSVLNMGGKGQRSVYITSGVVGHKLKQGFRALKHSPHSITMQAVLDNGAIWQRQISLVNGSYIVNVVDSITGGSGDKIFRQVIDRNPNKKLNTFYEHMGPTALLDGKMEMPDYKDLDKKGEIRRTAVGGWTAIMSRYFIAALISNKKQDYHYYFKGAGDTYQAGLIDNGKVVGNHIVFHSKMYIGPKSIAILKKADVGLQRSVDFGLVSFMSKPMHAFLLWMYGIVPNFGLCIIILVVLLKALFFWPTQKSYQSMAAMRKLQPEMARMKELYGDDRQKMSQEMTSLYKKNKVNPLGGCLPVIIQIPVFFALYKTLLISIEMRQAPFFGWIHDMSAHDPYYVLPVLMGISMFFQQRLNPKPPDPMQAKIMQFLPPVFTLLFLKFPAGLVLYWLVNNVLSIVQQKIVLKRMNVE